MAKKRVDRVVVTRADGKTVVWTHEADGVTDIRVSDTNLLLIMGVDPDQAIGGYSPIGWIDFAVTEVEIPEEPVVAP